MGKRKKQQIKKQHLCEQLENILSESVSLYIAGKFLEKDFFIIIIKKYWVNSTKNVCT